MIDAKWWEPADDGAAAFCLLCFRNCKIRRGASGICKARRYSHDGFLSPHLGRFVSIAIDPIEKKPLRRWRPGTQILSLGGLRCNLECPFCQNHSIAHPLGALRERSVSPEQLVEIAKRSNLSSVAYTYNEPTLQAEYIAEASKMLRAEGIATVMVTNGMFSPPVREELIGCVDAMNIDVKTFDEERYKRLGGSLDAVKRNVERLAEAGVHVELTSLVVPGISDSPDDFARMVAWISGVSRDIPLHVSRYFPAYKYDAPPTPPDLITKFRGIAASRLKYVYAGNM
jgi:pyruvate formate lyase activating enzyme